jgi:hypothetical protein
MDSRAAGAVSWGSRTAVDGLVSVRWFESVQEEVERGLSGLEFVASLLSLWC